MHTTDATLISGKVSPLAAVWHDPKRYLWLFSLVVPSLVGLGPLLHLYTGNAAYLWIPFVFMYGCIPLIDTLLGEDDSNPPDEALEKLEDDNYYRYLTWALIPVPHLSFAFNAWFATTQSLPWHGVLATVLSCGIVGGFCINLAHEMGHKRTSERFAALFVLSCTCYGHFMVEHNKSHHRDVSTFEDTASSRMGESIYSFMLREMPGGFARAWKEEASRLGGEGGAADRWWRVWSPFENQVLGPLVLTAIWWGALCAALGWSAAPFLVAASFWSNFQLTSANYLEHYGILRGTDPVTGKPETVLPCHSWNSNHIFSNLVLFHLQRHSDHHAHPLRRYQTLRHFDAVPRLPSGYASMFVIAWIPPLWFFVMNERLLESVGRDHRRINFDPAAKGALMKAYKLHQ
jgi:alkane 1-monooxygenase